LRDADRKGVEAIDTTFETPIVLDVVVSPRRIDLVERTLEAPLTKRYPIADAFAAWSTWDTAWVAEDGGRIVGFAAVEYEAWHRRLVLWHLYVAPSHRRSGIGRTLLEHAEQHGRTRRASHVWLETSNVNVPGIAAYERLGYALCGADVRLYDGLPYTHERALYLAKPL
jgi:ribosomal protein S18 acetylase RimI-like enzyme